MKDKILKDVSTNPAIGLVTPVLQQDGFTALKETSFQPE
jgi:hypothetical protein